MKLIDSSLELGNLYFWILEDLKVMLFLLLVRPSSDILSSKSKASKKKYCSKQEVVEFIYFHLTMLLPWDFSIEDDFASMIVLFFPLKLSFLIFNVPSMNVFSCDEQLKEWQRHCVHSSTNFFNTLFAFILHL